MGGTAYTGIGSRRASVEAFQLAHKLAFYLANHGLRLRSGGATGMDTAFENGHRAYFAAKSREPANLEVYRPFAVPAWCYAEVANYLDPGVSLAGMRPGVRDLLARNMQQVLGVDGQTPSRFVLYWTAERDGRSPKAGGTRYAVRCAEAHGVATLNLLDSDFTSVLSWVVDQLG